MDVVQCMRPVHVVSRIFGLAYYSVSRKKGAKVKIERCSRWCELVYVVGYLAKFASTVHNFFVLINGRYNSGRPVILRYTVIFEALAAFLTNLILFVFSYAGRTDQMKLWRDLVELDLDLKTIKCSVRYKFVRVTSYLILSGETLLLLAFATEMITLPQRRLLQAALFYEWQFLRMAFRLQLIMWFVLFREIFLALARKYGDAIVSDYNAGEVPKLRVLHERACKLVWRVNYVFSAQILSSISLDFGIITVLSYYSYTTLFHKDERQERCAYLLWVALYVFDMFILTVASYKCCTAANNIVKCNLCSITEDADEINSERKEEMHAFILQLLHNETKITASGFFKVDGSLIFAMASALTTYLVILIQFDQNLGVAFSNNNNKN